MKTNAIRQSPPRPPSARLVGPVPPPGGPGRFQGSVVLRFTLLLALLFTVSAPARTIYVSRTGSDANSGTAADPYATVQKAFYMAADGDAILINAGDYIGNLSSTKRLTVSSIAGTARIEGITNQPSNSPPVVNAGLDQTVMLSTAAALSGTATDDGRPTGALTVQWSKVSGPGTVTVANPASQQTTARFSAVGTYVLSLTASDGALSASDTVAIQVILGGGGGTTSNCPPVVNAGLDQTVTLSTAAALSATVTDDGKPNPPGAVTVQWSKVSGPGTVTVANPASRQTTARFSAVGIYVLSFTGSDGALSASDTVAIQVTTAPSAPLVNAGADQTITLPARASLNGQATDDGLPNPPGRLTVTWSKVIGPGTVSFANTQAPVTTAGFSVAGTYVLRLTATDGQNTRTNDLTVTVNPQPTVNSAPVVNAGADQTVAAPSAVTLSGSVSDDGLPNPPGRVTLQWSKVSGPGQVTFQSATSAATRVTMNEVGTYVLRLTANDGQYSRSDDVQIIYSGGGSSGRRVQGAITYAIGGSYGFAFNAVVEAVRDGVVYGRTTSGSNGRYELVGLPYGQFTIRASYQGYSGTWCCVWLQSSSPVVVDGCNVLVNKQGALAVVADAGVEETSVSVGAGVIQPPDWLPDGRVVLRFNGWVDAEYVVEYSTDLVLWSELTTVIATTPECEVVDEAAAAEPRRFYRLRMVE